MIQVQNGLFHLQTDAFSYLFRLTSHGQPEHLHFGAPISSEDADALACKPGLLNAHDGRTFAFDNSGNCWRAYVFVEHARAFEVLETPEQAFRIGEGFGGFQRDLVDLPGRLHETIPDFHNTPKRVEALEAAVKADPLRYLI